MIGGELFVMKAELSLYRGREILALEEEFLLTEGWFPRLLTRQRSMGSYVELVSTS